MWSACCPAHDDKNPSLLLWVGKSGNLLARCKSGGCSWAEIVEACGSNKKDWFPEMSNNGTQTQQVSKGKVTATYQYTDYRGHLLYEQCRIEPGRAGNPKRFAFRRPQPGGGGWIWGLDDDTPRVLYRLPEILDENRKNEPVYVVEGEKDVETLRALGLLATTNSGGALSWHYEYGKDLRGRRCVIIPDNDEPGHRHAVQVAGSLAFWGAKKFAIVHLPIQIEGGDVTDWLASFKSKEEKVAALREVVTKAAKWERS